MRNFEIKQELAQVTDKIALLELEHRAQVGEMQKVVDAHLAENAQLKRDLADER